MSLIRQYKVDSFSRKLLKLHAQGPYIYYVYTYVQIAIKSIISISLQAFRYIHFYFFSMVTSCKKKEAEKGVLPSPLSFFLGDSKSYQEKDINVGIHSSGNLITCITVAIFAYTRIEGRSKLVKTPVLYTN